MSGIVEMFRDAQETHGRDRFACSATVWEFALELGEAFGWQPYGTTYRLAAKSRVTTPARRDYQPGEAVDRKRIEAEDAIAWAGALETAKRSAHFAAMLESRAAAMTRSGEVTVPLPSLFDELIVYLYGGAFIFAVSAEVDPKTGDDARL
jgi:hypothetical protein